MLWPSTRATWNPKVTIRTAYTAADTSVLTQAISSSFTCASRMPGLMTADSGAAAA